MPRRLIIALLFAVLANAAAAQEIMLRHNMTGVAKDVLATLVLRFNDEQRGKAKVVLQELSGVEDRQKMSALALMNECDVTAFFGTRPSFKPVADVARAAGLRLTAGSFLPQIADAVTDPRRKIEGLPLAMTLPVLFYNKAAFVRAGLDPDLPPRTWHELQEAAGKLYDAGVACPLTSSRFTWVHVENVAARHGDPVTVRTRDGERFAFNNLVQVRHLALLASWQKSRYFHYFGPGSEGDAKFASGECAMLTGESALYGELKAANAFPVGAALLPYYEDMSDVRPGNVVPDGAALWALAGMKKAEEKVAARFMAFLMRPQVQREWVAGTGFLPMTSAALDALEAAGASPSIIDAARTRLSMPAVRNGRLHPSIGRSRLRSVLDEEIACVWNNTKPAKEALDTAMERAGRP